MPMFTTVLKFLELLVYLWDEVVIFVRFFYRL